MELPARFGQGDSHIVGVDNPFKYSIVDINDAVKFPAFDGFISRLNPTLKLYATIFLGLVFAN